jgi:molecular chaperone DnaK (HSP70)
MVYATRFAEKEEVSILVVDLGGSTLDVAGVLVNADPNNSFLQQARDPLKSYYNP